MIDADYRDSYPTLWRLLWADSGQRQRARMELQHLLQATRAEEATACARVAAERERYCERELGRAAAATGIVQGAVIATQSLRRRLEDRATTLSNEAEGVWQRIESLPRLPAE